MTVKEFKQHTNAKIQVLIPSNDIYDVYHDRTQEHYLYVTNTSNDHLTIDFFEINEYENNTINVYTVR